MKLVLDRTSNMTDSQDVKNEQESEVLKGDTVVDELYRSKLIASTLMSLYEIDKNGWTKELENQFRTLWDLSMKKEVISHLMLCDFPKIAKNTLMISNNP
ncbi:uncharacterized protein [Temnothorax longispinosus]|uniref:uncharacterized protein isoform X2 n=1 Tax=Temnothorax longispinosus TaxID=300112 RepID=UPI003A9945B5